MLAPTRDVAQDLEIAALLYWSGTPNFFSVHLAPSTVPGAEEKPEAVMDTLQRQRELREGRGGVFSQICTTSIAGTLAAVSGTLASCICIVFREWYKGDLEAEFLV